jgi:hypothetical protein
MKKKIWVLEMLVRADFAKKRTIEPHVIICSLRPIPRAIRSRKTRAPHFGALKEADSRHIGVTALYQDYQN